MTPYQPDRTGSAGGEPGFVGRMVSGLVTFIVVVVTVGFSIFLLAAATGHLDTVKGLLGL